MRSWAISLAAIGLAVVLAASRQEPPVRSNCETSGELVQLPRLREASGVAASRRTPGLFWAHNDSDEPVLFALDERGAMQGDVRVTGAAVEDWEDVAVGPCAHGSCVYVADIGDNDGERRHVTIYRTREPAPSDEATAAVEAFHAAYPDGPQDAESLFVTPDGGLFIVTKGSPGAVALYRFPKPLTSGAVMRLERVGAPDGDRRRDSDDRPTAADVSPDGRWVAVRTNRWIAFHPAAEFLAGRWREALRTDLRPLGEPQGEGIAFGGPDSVVLVGEGDGSGTFARLACTFNSR